MGLLDNDQLMLGLSLMAAGAAKPVRTGFGEGLLGALSNVQGMQDRRAEMAAREEERKQRAAMQAMQAQQIQMQLADRQRQQQQEQDQRNYLGAMDSSAGPAIQPTLPAMMARGFSLPEIGALMPQAKGPEYKVVGKSLVRIGPDGVAPAFQEADKPDLNSLIVMGPDGKPTLNKLLFDAKRSIAGAGAANVSYGAMATGIGPDGQPAFFLPPKDPKTPPAIISGIKPPAGAEARPTEDQAKAAGWLSQAENAYKNMVDSGFTKDKSGALQPKPEAYPGAADLLEKVPIVGGAANALRSADRQKFMQASSSMSEALLRAATGAGVNMDEARQKVQELTPVWGERPETTKQKMASIPIYINSLKTRAGKAAASASAATPTSAANPSDPLGIRGGP